MKAKWAVLLFTLTGSTFAQTWAKTEKTDPLRGTNYMQYSLEGKFLTSPQNATPNTHPVIIAQCTPGDFNHHTAHGKLLKAYIFVGGVLDSHVASDSGSRVTVQFRLDDGKLQTDYWTASTNFSALFFNPYFPEGGFATMLYGHMLPHKENTSPPVKKIVLGVPEYLGGEVVMQFDMPDPTEVADACGEIKHKRGE